MSFFSWLFSWLTPNRVNVPNANARPHSKNKNPKKQRKHGYKEDAPTILWEDGYSSKVAGTSHYQDELLSICGGHNRDGHAHETIAMLVRDPENLHDPNAIKVEIEGRCVGFLPKQQVEQVAADMDSEGFSRSRVEAQVVGGWRTNQYDQGSFGVRLKMPSGGPTNFGTAASQRRIEEHSLPRNTGGRPDPASSGPLAGTFCVIWGASSKGDEAKEVAAWGAHVMAGVGKSTSLIVQVPDEPTSKMLSSAVYKKVQELQSQGYHVKIVQLSALRANAGRLPEKGKD